MGESGDGGAVIYRSGWAGRVLLHPMRALGLIVAAALPILCACASETRRVADAPSPPSSSIEPELPPLEDAFTTVDWKATWGPADDRIAYLHRSTSGEPAGVYEVLLDGHRRPTSRRVVLRPRLEVSSFRYSPDSRLLTLCMSADIYVLDLETGGLRQVTRTRDAMGIDWHPDGRHIFYVRGTWSPDIYPPADSGNVRLVDVESLNDEPLRFRGGRVLWGGEARIARDGRRVLISRCSPETRGSEIFLYSPDFDQAERLTSRGWMCDSPAWHQNDTRILFRVDVPVFSPDPWYSVTPDGGNLSPYLRPGLILNLGLRAEFNWDGTMFVITARDADSEDGVSWIRQIGAGGVVAAWQVTDYR